MHRIDSGILKGGNLAKEVIRLFVAPWYLLGWLSHVYLALTNPEMYRSFGQTALFPEFTDLWNDVMMPHIAALALLLAAFELLVGILLIDRGDRVEVGLVLSIGFNLFLVQLGLGWYPVPAGLQGFLVNRLPNLVFVVLQIPLLWATYPRSLPAVVRGWFQQRGCPAG